MPKLQQLNIDTLNQVKDYLQAGQSREKIYLELLQAGWKLDDIEAIFQRVKKQEDNKGSFSQKTAHLILVIGAVLVGAGIFSFIAANWQGIDKFAKLAVIIAALLLSHASGWYLMEKKFHKKIGEILVLLGSIIFGAGLFLVAQIFNIRANWPDGFVLWMVGVLFMAHMVKSYLQYILAISLGLVALFSYPFIIFGHRFAPYFFSTPVFLFSAAFILFVVGLKIRHRLPEEFKKYY